MSPDLLQDIRDIQADLVTRPPSALVLKQIPAVLAQINTVLAEVERNHDNTAHSRA